MRIRIKIYKFSFYQCKVSYLINRLSYHLKNIQDIIMNLLYTVKRAGSLILCLTMLAAIQL